MIERILQSKAELTASKMLASLTELGIEFTGHKLDAHTALVTHVEALLKEGRMKARTFKVLYDNRDDVWKWGVEIVSKGSIRFVLDCHGYDDKGRREMQAIVRQFNKEVAHELEP